MTPEALDSLSKQELIALALAFAERVAALDARAGEQETLVAEQQAFIAKLEARIAELEARLGRPPKTPRNSSLPPSAGHKEKRPHKPRRRRKGRPGVSRPLAQNPDHVRDVFATSCKGCGHALSQADQPEVAHAYDHIDLPPPRVIVTRVHLRRGACPCCGGRVIGTAPGDMPPGSPFGLAITAVVAFFHARHLASYSRLTEILQVIYGLKVSEGAIANMLERAVEPFAEEAKRIEAEVRQAPVIACDETSARVMGETCWQWVFGTPTAVSHRIAFTRSAAVVRDFLAGATPEVWLSDRLASQSGHGKAHQVCLAHLLRDATYAIEAGDTVFAPGFKALLKDALRIGERRPDLADATLLGKQRDLEGRLAKLLASKPAAKAGRQLRDGIEKCRDKLFVFVTRRDVPPTNNVSERDLRPSVIFRKVTNGFRSPWGALLYADICSVMATAARRGINALDAIRNCLAGRHLLIPP